ncbi:MAG: hypothetical protein HPY61_09700 [Methanotrichaceae archaeon]|nr:hypothetical protein [Methanotrichaceae archaeon]
MVQLGGIGILRSSAISLFILIIILSSSCEAKVGYNIYVDMDGTQWGRSQTTQVMTFTADSDCSGKGNSSKYVNMPGFGGVGLKENTYTKEGRMANKNIVNLTAKFNWIYINEEYDAGPLNNTTVEDDFVDLPTTQPQEHYYVEINESLPIMLRYEDDTAYVGEGIYSRNNYKSDEDSICTNYYATNLSKAVRYAGVYSNAIVRVNIAPGQVDEREMKNSATAFRVLSISDKYSRLGYRSSDRLSDEVYIGSFKIDRTISRRSRFNLTSLEFGLGCCAGDTLFVKEPYCWDIECIFDAHNPASYIKM